MAETKRKKRKGFTWNIGTVIFGAIFLYIVICLLLVLSRTHVEYYQVVSGPLARNNTYTGIALRSETVIYTDTSGYVSYYAQGNARIRKSGILFGIGPNKSEETTGEVSASAKKEIYDTIRFFALRYDANAYHSVYSLKYDVTGKIVTDTPVTVTEAQSNALRTAGTFTLGSETIKASPKDGIVVYQMDGYEEADASDLSAEDFKERDYSLMELRTGERLSAGDPVLKLIDSEDWSLVIPLTPLEVIRLDGVSSIRVKFLADGVTQTAKFSILTAEDGSYYGKLDFESGMIRYLNDRFIDIELVTNARAGLKIPLTSITTKAFYTIPEEYATEGGEDNTTIGFLREVVKNGRSSTEFVSTTLYEHKNGKYYIDASDLSEGDTLIRPGTENERYTIRQTDTLEGVYCTNKGYAMFRKIIILDKNEEYCIVESGTRYGIAQYDYIVLNAKEVKEEQIIARK